MDQAKTLANLEHRLSGAAGSLPPRLHRAAAALLKSPEDVAFLSMRELAQKSGLSPTTFVRLARQLGFDGYPALRQVFIDHIRGTPAGFSSRAKRLQHHGRGSEADLVEGLFASKARVLEHTLERNPLPELRAVCERIESARRIFLVGQRSCYPVVYFFDYIYRLFSPKSVLISGEGGSFGDALRDLSREDVVIVVSIDPYTRNTVQAAHYAAEAGAHVVAITDSPMSPLAAAAARTLVIDPATPSFFHSITSALALVEALLALLMARGGEEALARLRDSEAQLSRFDVYWQPPLGRIS